MTTAIRPCPACGGENVLCCYIRPRSANVQPCARMECRDCGVCGPMTSDSIGEPEAAWNSLPRWPDWKPAGEPPEVPEGNRGVWILGWFGAPTGMMVCRYSRKLGWDNEVVTHWAPLPPAPGEMSP
jgi:hypothetical protein